MSLFFPLSYGQQSTFELDNSLILFITVRWNISGHQLAEMSQMVSHGFFSLLKSKPKQKSGTYITFYFPTEGVNPEGPELQG